jgi:hypothetical protein
MASPLKSWNLTPLSRQQAVALTGPYCRVAQGAQRFLRACVRLGRDRCRSVFEPSVQRALESVNDLGIAAGHVGGFAGVGLQIE